MGKKATDIVAYIGWIGWLIAFLAGDRQAAKLHLNQALVLNLLSIILSILSSFGGIITTVASILGVISFVLWIIGLVNACKGQDRPLPIIGGICILK